MRFHTLPTGIRFFSPIALAATFFGSGLIRPASGTWGSLAAFGVGLVALSYVPSRTLVFMSIVAYLIGFLAAREWAKADASDTDPSAIVIDEVAGMVARQTEEELFKPNVAVVIVDFLMRRGFVSPDDDGYLELLAELRNAECR